MQPGSPWVRQTPTRGETWGAGGSGRAYLFHLASLPEVVQHADRAEPIAQAPFLLRSARCKVHEPGRLAVGKERTVGRTRRAWLRSSRKRIETRERRPSEPEGT